MIQQVEDDGYTKIGDASEILNRDEEDGLLVEAPSLVKVDGTYYLTFSSNMYDTEYYDTSFATSSSVTGPYTKAKDPYAPIIKTDMYGLWGPGGADQLIVPGQNAIVVFHGWDSSAKNARYMYASSVQYGDGNMALYFD